jgi:phospholipid/cholesterol/gamma-HCH transport system permease protein
MPMLKSLLKRIEDVGHYFEFVASIFRTALKPPFRFELLLTEIEQLGVNSMLIIILAGLAIGMIFALQMVSLLEPFQAELATGAAVAVALARELAPIITTMMLIAKNGSSMAAELGTMRVTEQIDALESMSVSPVHYLVLPRVVASVLVSPDLTLLENLVGVIGSFFISTRLYGLDSAAYLDYMFNVLKPKDIYIGLIMAAIMGFIVSTICTYFGLSASRGAKGVGDGATKAVVASSVSILVADYILASLMMVVFK